MRDAVRSVFKTDLKYAASACATTVHAFEQKSLLQGTFAPVPSVQKEDLHLTYQELTDLTGKRVVKPHKKNACQMASATNTYQEPEYQKSPRTRINTQAEMSVQSKDNIQELRSAISQLKSRQHEAQSPRTHLLGLHSVQKMKACVLCCKEHLQQCRTTEKEDFHLTYQELTDLTGKRVVVASQEECLSYGKCHKHVSRT